MSANTIEQARPSVGVTGTKRRKRSATRNAIEWALIIVAALLVALVVLTFFFQAFFIPSESMEPTLKPGDRVLVNQLSYDLHSIHRGDIVVCKRPPSEGATPPSRT